MGFLIKHCIVIFLRISSFRIALPFQRIASDSPLPLARVALFSLALRRDFHRKLRFPWKRGLSPYKIKGNHSAENKFSQNRITFSADCQ